MTEKITTSEFFNVYKGGQWLWVNSTDAESETPREAKGKMLLILLRIDGSGLDT